MTNSSVHTLDVRAVLSERPGGVPAGSVWIVDDHELLLDALAGVLRESFTVTGAFRDYDTTLARFKMAVQQRTDTPDFLILDFNLTPGNPDGRSGLDLMAAVKKVSHRTPCIFLSGHPDHFHVHAALAAGCSGVLSKATPPAQILAALNVWWAERSEGRTTLALDNTTTEMALASLKMIRNPTLTDRQIEILTLIAAGLTRAEVADTSNCAVSTIQGHLTACYARLNVSNAVAAVAAAQRLGLIAS
jgi:DNA-binding NarL/FixJ family response regulator